MQYHLTLDDTVPQTYFDHEQPLNIVKFRISLLITIYCATMVSPTARKKIHLNFFETACRGNHECAGQWFRPGDNSYTKDTLEYYVNMAKLAEKAKITSIFFADTYAGHDVYSGNTDAVFRAGVQVAQLNPLVIVSAMAVSSTPPIPLKETILMMKGRYKICFLWCYSKHELSCTISCCADFQHPRSSLKRSSCLEYRYELV